jgi:hypothetical protein
MRNDVWKGKDQPEREVVRPDAQVDAEPDEDGLAEDHEQMSG